MKSQRHFFASALALSVLLAGAASADRPEADRARDTDRKPLEVMAFLGIEPGMTAIDLIAASGYYSEVLAEAVGPTGKVYAQNNKYVLEMRDGANEKAMSARLADGRLPNVERLDREVLKLGLEPGSVDVAFTALNFHDIYNGRGSEAAVEFLKAVRTILKPGGVLGLIDHDGNADQDNKKLHRIPRALVIETATAAGFEFEGEGEMLRHPEDDRSRGVFAEGLRGKTDRFVLKFRKASGAAPAPVSGSPR